MIFAQFIKKAKVSLQAFLPDDNEIIKIIEMCGLELFDKNNWKEWHDNVENKIYVTDDKKLFIKNIKIKHKITDIYFKSKPLQIANNSKLVMISVTNNNNYFVWFVGNDDRIRMLCYINHEWENRLPLSSNIETIRTIIKNLDINDYKVIDGIKIKKESVIKTIISTWPPSQNMKTDMILTNKIGQKILSDCGAIDV